MTINQWIKEYIDDNNVDYPKGVDSIDSAIKLFMVDNIHKVETGESYVTINDWIKEYCQENDIELPFGVGDTITALDFLRVCATGGGVESVENQSIASFDDGSDSDVEELIVSIEPVQAGSGEPSPDNVRPISGWDSLRIYVTGKNLFYTQNSANKTHNGITFTDNGDGTITANGTATGDAYVELSSYLHYNGPFIYTGNPSGSSSSTYRTQARWRNFDNTWGDWGYINGASGNINANHATGFRIRLQIKSGVTVGNIVFKPMLRPASDTDNTFEPYVGTTYPISWQSEAGTVYGGTLDVTTGELVVDRAIADLGALTYSLQGTYYYRAAIPNAKVGLPNAFCTARKMVFPNRTAITSSDELAPYNNSNNFICGLSAGYESASAFKESLNGVYLCYEIATPQNIQLSPTQVKTLLGKNNIWVDTGDIIKLDYNAKIFNTDGMDINQWIKHYCTVKDITLPTDIPDVITTLNFLLLNGE